MNSRMMKSCTRRKIAPPSLANSAYTCTTSSGNTKGANRHPSQITTFTGQIPVCRKSRPRLSRLDLVVTPTVTRHIMKKKRKLPKLILRTAFLPTHVDDERRTWRALCGSVSASWRRDLPGAPMRSFRLGGPPEGVSCPPGPPAPLSTSIPCIGRDASGGRGGASLSSLHRSNPEASREEGGQVRVGMHIINNRAQEIETGAGCTRQPLISHRPPRVRTRPGANRALGRLAGAMPRAARAAGGVPYPAG
mmetsp:Transcript_57450/g.181907  ORF Transcript_57450/g.181907 Transcript_57450/m.181907 type:complete len:249 (-) Transcript_57450:4542-5288(-)